MAFPIAQLRDDFTNNTIDPLWETLTSGSGTVAETGGQMRCTLPSSTAGTHVAYVVSTATYDLTGDGVVWNIETMVATGVAATVTLDLYVSNGYVLRWRQLSNAITARSLVASVDTQHYTAAWSASTYKYLRIRESGGTIFWDSSTNGTTWTNRASLANPFAVTALYLQFGASCGNVASPGSLRLDDLNLILPAPSATWRETTADWQISNRLRSVTLASDGGKQGAIVTADTMDSARVLGGTVRYFAGPLGSSSGGFLQLTEYASLALAQASPFLIPVDGRVDLPVLVDARYMRLYHRSIDASAHTIYEYMPRRLVQADDIEAESITAINISAGAITADKINVLDLSAITATIGQLTIASSSGLNAWLYQGSGTGDSPTTGLKLFNSGGIGKLSGYNATVEQITIDTDGKLKWGGGVGVLDASGMEIVGAAFDWSLTNGSPVTLPDENTIRWSSTGQDPTITGSDDGQLLLLAEEITLGVPLTSTVSAGMNINSSSAVVENVSTFSVRGDNLGSADFEITTALTASSSTTAIRGGLNLGTGTGATGGQISASGSAGFGVGAQSNVRLIVRGQDATSSNFALFVQDSAAATLFSVRDDGAVQVAKSGAAIGFYGSAGTTKPTVSGSRAGNAALASLLTALSNLGLLTDSSS